MFKFLFLFFLSGWMPTTGSITNADLVCGKWLSAEKNLIVHVFKEGTDYTATTMGPTIPGRVACGRRGCIGGYGWGAYGAPIDTDIQAVDYTEGTLMLDLVDAGSGKLAWRGTSQKRVDTKDADQAQLNAILLDLTKDMPGLPAAK